MSERRARCTIRCRRRRVRLRHVLDRNGTSHCPRARRIDFRRRTDRPTRRSPRHVRKRELDRQVKSVKTRRTGLVQITKRTTPPIVTVVDATTTSSVSFARLETRQIARADDARRRADRATFLRRTRPSPSLSTWYPLVSRTAASRTTRRTWSSSSHPLRKRQGATRPVSAST